MVFLLMMFGDAGSFPLHGNSMIVPACYQQDVQEIGLESICFVGKDRKKPGLPKNHYLGSVLEEELQLAVL